MTRTSYSKADVERDYHGSQDENGEGLPCVNVKASGFWHRSMTDKVLREAAIEGGHDPDAFAPWFRANYGDEADPHGERLQTWWDAVAEGAWEGFQTDAEELFGSGVKVYGEGRQGGWLVAHGLPPIASWDAIMLGKWRRFERWCQSACEEETVAANIAMLIVINAYDAAVTERERLDRIVSQWAGLAGLVVTG